VSTAAATVARTTQRDVLGGVGVEWLCEGVIVWLFGFSCLSVFTRYERRGYDNFTTYAPFL
jgi:hypothetical protein